VTYCAAAFEIALNGSKGPGADTVVGPLGDNFVPHSCHPLLKTKFFFQSCEWVILSKLSRRYL
jgi:hypothetical protein